MTLEELQKFIKKEHKRMVEKWGEDEDQKQRTLDNEAELSSEIIGKCSIISIRYVKVL